MRIVIIGGILLSVLGLWYAFSGVAFGAVLAQVQQLDGRLFWLSQGCFLLMLVLRAVRWRYLLLKLKSCAFMPVFSATVIGMMANNFLPARMGEVTRAVFLGRRENLSSASVLANVVVERAADMLTLLVLLCVYLGFAASGREDQAF